MKKAKSAMLVLLSATLLGAMCLACANNPPPTSRIPPPTPRPTPALSPTVPPTSTPTKVPSPAATPPAPSGEAQTYTVRSGDTLSGIAQEFGISLQALLDANGISAANAHLIKIGQKLTIPGKSPTPPPATAVSTPPATARATQPAPVGTPQAGAPAFRSIAFGTEIGPDNRPKAPATRFPAGSTRIYACFSFENMAKSKDWTYVWLKGADELYRETGRWGWGDSGSAWVYRTSWEKGTYEFRLFIDGQLQGKATFTID